MKKGDIWFSKADPVRGFRVLDVNKDGSIEVEVDRVVRDKNGQVKVAQRNRSVNRNDIPYFTLGYQQES